MELLLSTRNASGDPGAWTMEPGCCSSLAALSVIPLKDDLATRGKAVDISSQDTDSIASRHGPG